MKVVLLSDTFINPGEFLSGPLPISLRNSEYSCIGGTSLFNWTVIVLLITVTGWLLAILLKSSSLESFVNFYDVLFCESIKSSSGTLFNPLTFLMCGNEFFNLFSFIFSFV